MFVKWSAYAMFTLKVDGVKITNPKLPFSLDEGWHHFELIGSKLSTRDLIKKIICGWVSGLCGAVVYTLEDAFKDVYDDYISFNFFTSVKTKNIIIDDIEDSLESKICKITKKKVVNKKRLTYMLTTMLFPLLILCLSLSTIFICLGIVSINSNKKLAGLFSVLFGILVLFLTLFFIVKLIRTLKNRRDGPVS